MTPFKTVWRITFGLLVALSACAEGTDTSEGDLTEVESHEQASAVAPCTWDGATPVMVGDLVAHQAYPFKVGSGGVLCPGNWTTFECPSGYTLLGWKFSGSGFWFCARNDVANRTFYLGDVEDNNGNYYRIDSSGVTTLAGQYWNTCLDGSTFLGRWFDQNGFWVCIK